MSKGMILVIFHQVLLVVVMVGWASYKTIKEWSHFRQPDVTKQFLVCLLNLALLVGMRAYFPTWIETLPKSIDLVLFVSAMFISAIDNARVRARNKRTNRVFAK